MTEYTEDSFVDIPLPSVVEEADGFADAGAELGRTKEYARLLWTQLTDVTAYLRTDLARSGVLATDEQWSQWQKVYARSLSALAGPTGDSGYGQSQAVLERQFGQQH